jgi:hypothetical protein
MISKACVEPKGFEPLLRLLMLVRAVNEENILVKESGEKIES